MSSAPPSDTPPVRGLDGVVAVQTRLSHVDGQNGVLIIGGYELEELAGRVTFEETAHLLWTGRLPARAEAQAFSGEIAALRAIPQSAMAAVCEAAKRGAPPIDALRMACSMLSLDLGGPERHLDVPPTSPPRRRWSHGFPRSSRRTHGRSRAGSPIAPRPDLSLAANVLYMVNREEPDADRCSRARHLLGHVERPRHERLDVHRAA